MPYAFDFAVPGLGLQADLKRIVSGNKTIAEVVAAAKVRYKEAFATVKMEAGRLDEALYGNFDIVLAHFSRVSQLHTTQYNTQHSTLNTQH